VDQGDLNFFSLLNPKRIYRGN